MVDIVVVSNGLVFTYLTGTLGLCDTICSG